MRLRGRKGIRESLEAQPELVVLEAQPHKGRWHELFGNDHPIYVELGMGKGRFITDMSVRNPDINYIGIDMYDELIRRASDKARVAWAETSEENPCNLALVLANIETIEEIFAPGEIQRIHLNFSDPWPKSKHARRRLTHSRFVAKYIEILNEWGEIHFKTDSESLFEFSLNSFADMELPMRNISLNLHKDGLRDDLVLTEYEAKFVDRGNPIYRLEAIIGKNSLAEHRETKRHAQLKDQVVQTSIEVAEPNTAPATTSEG
ncbi:tRNA (guanosine(46)-N7)-methyltransferase TrmB [Paenibacillus nasutitermitis]|uniref:tRNA (guanine-N(7)-)-methyltransferase n=1 Tax=Paenibacillus nasutitermitis TaxID=1652958 RepID=A0A916YJ33_9BACL|nr:tRNA (guanosine(46)-N7)-methyltransferase TrmB [Paenibacillus nasutitermitis]GGD48162.1 tRNA (guanine-N(7)-)-methyltransferase [Paenibacillus nasutitermitis]